MRTPILGAWIVATLAVATPELFGAQEAAIVLAHDDEDDDRYYGRSRWGSYSPAGRAIRDLEFIASRSYVDRHEYAHFRRAIHELYAFEDRLRRGRFDKGRLDEAIENINHLAHADQIHPRDRARLRGHLYELRRFRSERGRYGY